MKIYLMRNKKMEIKRDSKISGIYAWENKVNGKRYIGKAKNLYRRIYDELNGFNNGKHQNLKKLFNAVQKYGINNFDVIKLLEAPNQHLSKIEKLLIEYYDTKKSGYNCTSGGEGMFGHKVTKCQIEKQKKKLKEYWTDERKLLHSEKMKNWANDPIRKQHLIDMGKSWINNPNFIKKQKENTLKSLTTNRIEKQRKSLKKYYENNRSKKAISVLMINPQGIQLNIIGIDRFCKKYNFGYSSIQQLVNGQKLEHKGWKIVKKEI